MKKIYLSGIILILSVVFMASCVKNEVKTITLNKSTSNLILGQNDSLIATLDVTGDIKKLPETWTSSDPAIAKVGSTGLVTGIAKGTTIVTVKAGDKSATCQINVADQLLPNFTNAIINYYADYYKTTLSNNSVLILYGPSDTLLLEVNTPLSAIDSIPSGAYEIITNLDLSSFNQFLPNTVLPAFQYQGSLFGSWFYNRAIFTPIMQGNMTCLLKNKYYSIQYNLFDYFGNSISGTYQGIIKHFDHSSPSTAPSSTRSNIKVKMKSASYNLKLLKR